MRDIARYADSKSVNRFYERNKPEIPWAKQIEPEAGVASPDKLTDMILEPGGML